MWGLGIFFNLIYLLIFFSLLVYILPILLSSLNSNSLRGSYRSTFYIISALESSLFIFAFPTCILLIFGLWSSYDVAAWFGHLLFSCFHWKIFFFIVFVFFIMLYYFLTVTYLSSSEIYDFVITKYSFFFWVLILFWANTVFTVIFVIEVLSTLIFLLITTSTYSTSFFYKNIVFDSKNFFQSNLPFTFLQSLIFFFWISLLSSLNLFLFCIFLVIYISTFDWFLIEHIFNFLLNAASLRDILRIGTFWFFIIFSIFLKCGLAPFYLWKPTFFKGLSFSTLFFYIGFFYFLFFLFIINFLLIFMHEIFYYFVSITAVLVVLGLLTLLCIICESFYIKIFLSVSSILNSLLVITALTSAHSIDLHFFL